MTSENNSEVLPTQMQALSVDADKEARKAAKKAAKEAKKAEKLARQARLKEQQLLEQQRNIIVVDDYREAQFGDLKLIQSSNKSGRIWTNISDIDENLSGQSVWIRARLHAVRAKGKVAFLILRQCTASVQAILSANDEIPRDMVGYAGKVPPESVLDVYGSIAKVDTPVLSTSQTNVEIRVHKLFVVSASDPVLPLQLADAARPCVEDREEQQENEDEEMPTVGRDVRLNNRWVDLRTAANHAIFRLQSAVCRYFRDYFVQRDFVEVHTPKVISAASEGGSNVFKLEYFDRDAFLAQSPQLYKQMCINADMKRVFEIGPVFRSEDSNTHRHLCEFTGLDFEMEIDEHYHEVLDTLGGVFNHIFDELNRNHQRELDVIRAQYPFEPLVYHKNPLVLHFKDAIAMLREAGDDEADEHTDLSTPQEKHLGRLVRAKFNTDFYIVDRYPMSARPFYTMPCPDDALVSNSYDVFLRGEEITSGAQRIHDYDMLKKAALANDPPIELQTIRAYLDSFRYGSSPHGGAGIGLERVVMLFCGLKNIRLTSMFPRDPKRIAP